VSVIVSLAVHDGAFDAPSLTSVRRVFQMKNRGPVMTHVYPVPLEEGMAQAACLPPIGRRHGTSSIPQAKGQHGATIAKL
jgi:hypothetical protein